MNEQQITQLATTISARSPFGLRNKLAARLGLRFTTYTPTWEMISRVAQAVWDARQANQPPGPRRATQGDER